MTNQHPITPPPELVNQWEERWCNIPGKRDSFINSYIATQAAQWGADQELEACVKWIEDCGYHPSVPEDFRAARRPKSPSLKEQALEALGPEPRPEATPRGTRDGRIERYRLVRCALEALPND